MNCYLWICSLCFLCSLLIKLYCIFRSMCTYLWDFFFFFWINQYILVNACMAKLILTPFEKARNHQGTTMRGVKLGIPFFFFLCINGTSLKINTMINFQSTKMEENQGDYTIKPITTLHRGGQRWHTSWYRTLQRGEQQQQNQQKKKQQQKNKNNNIINT